MTEGLTQTHTQTRIHTQMFLEHVDKIASNYVRVEFPRWLSSKEFGDVGLIPESERSPGQGNVNPLQYSCLGNPMDRGAWWAIVHGVSKESDTTK